MIRSALDTSIDISCSQAGGISEAVTVTAERRSLPLNK